MRGRIFLLSLAFLAAAGCGGAGEGGDDYVDRMAEEHAGDEPTPSPAAEAEPETAFFDEHLGG